MHTWLGTDNIHHLSIVVVCCSHGCCSTVNTLGASRQKLDSPSPAGENNLNKWLKWSNSPQNTHMRVRATILSLLHSDWHSACLSLERTLAFARLIPLASASTVVCSRIQPQPRDFCWKRDSKTLESYCGPFNYHGKNETQEQQEIKNMCTRCCEFQSTRIEMLQRHFQYHFRSTLRT